MNKEELKKAEIGLELRRKINIINNNLYRLEELKGNNKNDIEIKISSFYDNYHPYSYCIDLPNHKDYGTFQVLINLITQERFVLQKELDKL